MKKKILITGSGIILVIALLFTSVKIVNSQDYLNNDFFHFWLGGKLVREGLNPYDAQAWNAGHLEQATSWQPNQQFVYPLPVAMLFVPISLLPYKFAYISWVFLSQIALLLVMLMLFKRERMPDLKTMLPYALPILLGMAFFRPAFLSLRNGQLDVLLLLILTLAAVLCEDGKNFLCGLLLAALVLKPQLGAPILCFVTFWFLIKRMWSAVGGLAAGGGILLVLGCLLDANWVFEMISGWMNKGSELTYTAPANLWGLAGLLVPDGRAALILGAVLALVFISGCLLFIVRNKNKSIFCILSISIPVMLLTTRFAYSYHQIYLVLPIILTVLNMRRLDKPYLLSATLFLWIDILAVGLLLLALQRGNDVFSVVLPLVMLGLIWGLNKLDNLQPGQTTFRDPSQ